MVYYEFVISVGQLMVHMRINTHDNWPGFAKKHDRNSRMEMNTDIETDHWPKCNMEFLDKELAINHEKSTGHKIRERTLDK
ncbi:MAG: hypothetical protein ACRD8Z_18830 [Nitrososphaeraceae archaeon]